MLWPASRVSRAASKRRRVVATSTNRTAVHVQVPCPWQPLPTHIRPPLERRMTRTRCMAVCGGWGAQLLAGQYWQASSCSTRRRHARASSRPLVVFSSSLPRFTLGGRSTPLAPHQCVQTAARSGLSGGLRLAPHVAPCGGKGTSAVVQRSSEERAACLERAAAAQQAQQAQQAARGASDCPAHLLLSCHSPRCELIHTCTGILLAISGT